MGLRERLRHHENEAGDVEGIDPEAAVHDYRAALRSALPAVVVAAHT